MTTDTFSFGGDAQVARDVHHSAQRAAIALADQIEFALLACDHDSRLMYVNREGRRALVEGNAVTLVGDRVQCAAASHCEWSAAVRNAAINHRCRLFWVGSHDDRTMVIAMPIAIEGSLNPTAMVMLSRKSVCSKLGMELLASRHELTFAERRVFGALVGNTSPREIAAMHGVTVATIRTQIQSVREKLGVRSTDALMLRAAEVPPITSWK